MQPVYYAICVVVALYIAVCFGKIAAKNNRNPVLYGIVSLITPINLIILGYWAFAEKKGRLRLEINPGKRFRMPVKGDAGKAMPADGSS